MTANILHLFFWPVFIIISYYVVIWVLKIYEKRMQG
jgi:hypothetical protein